MYYRYDNRCIIVEKSETELTGERVCQSNLDLDIELYDIYVGKVVDGRLTYHTKIAKPAEQLAQRIKVMQEKLASQNDDISDLYDYVADSIYNDCLGDLGLDEESEVI